MMDSNLPLPLACMLLMLSVSSPAVAQEPTGSETPEPAEQAIWNMFRGDAGQSGIASGSLAPQLELQWTFEAEGAIVSSPVVAQGLVYFGSDDGQLRAVELETGKLRWAFTTEDIIEAPPMVHGDTVYVGSSDYYMYALDASSGKLRWKFETQDKVLGGAAWLPDPERPGGRLVFGSYDTHLYCLDAAKGSLIWSYQTANYVNGTPAIHEGRAVFGGCDAILHVVSTDTGKALAQIELGQESHVAGSAAFVDGRAYLGHYGNAFICVDIESEKTLWEHRHRDQAFFSSPAIAKDVVVFGGRDKRLHCVKRASGEELWSFPTRRKVDGSPVICGDKVVFGSGDGKVYLLRLADGAELWSYEVGRSIFSSPAVVDGRVLVGSNDSNLYCFGAAKASTDDEAGGE